MMETTVAMATHLAGDAHSRCWMLKLNLKDGTTLGFTTLDADRTFDLGDGDGAVTYAAADGVTLSNVQRVAGLDPDSFEAHGPLGLRVTREAVIGGRFDLATAWLFEVNFKDLSAGALRTMKGYVDDARVEGNRFVFDVVGSEAKLAQNVGEVIGPKCKARHGDARCKRIVEQDVATVTAVTSAMQFTVSFVESWDDGYFDGGEIQALTGALAGTLAMEVHRHGPAGAIELFDALVEAPQVGDTFAIRRGCPGTIVECAARGNTVNFRGEAGVRGNDWLKPALPGQGEAE